jgi:hypothetical protein
LRQLSLELALTWRKVLAVRNAIFTAGVTLACALLIAQGVLQCFAPQKLKDVQDRLRPKGDYWGSALGSFFERLREKQASEPSALYRFSGLMLMGMGILMPMVRTCPR